MIKDITPTFLRAELKTFDGIEYLTHHSSNEVWCRKDEVGFIHDTFLSSVTSAGKSTREITESDWNVLLEKTNHLWIWVEDEFTNPEKYEGVGLFEGEALPYRAEGKTVIRINSI